MINIHSVARWNKSRLSSLFFENTKKNSEFNEQRAFQFFFGNIVPKKEFELTEDLIETYKKYTVVQPGDIMINGLNLNYDFVTQRVGFVKNNGIITSAYLSLRARTNDINKRFYCYLLKTVDAQKMFHGLGTGIRLTLSFDDIKNFRIPVPPRDEQDQIVRFLDWKVLSINKLINAKSQEIKSLVELKRSMVSSVVTCGLVKNAPMRFSGVKWLGDIPAHWEKDKIGALFAERKTKVSDKEYRPLSVAQIGVVLQLDTAVKTDAGDNRKLVCAGDFVINSRSDRKGSCGVSELDGSVSLINTVLIPRGRQYGKYIHYLMRSQPFSEEFYRNGRGIVSDLWTTRFSEMKEIFLPIPPMDEQMKISDYIEQTELRIQETTVRITKEVEILEEYKTKLIADVVTGQIDVRGIEIPEYEFVEEVGLDEADEDATPDARGDIEE